MLVFSEFKAANQHDYDLNISMQGSYISNILSLPTINNYLLPLLKSGLKVDFKLLFRSYYFLKVSDNSEEEKSQARV